MSYYIKLLIEFIVITIQLHNLSKMHFYFCNLLFLIQREKGTILNILFE